MSTKYPCLYKDIILKICSQSSTYFATNNTAKFGHICTRHYDSLSADQKFNYELKLDD